MKVEGNILAMVVMTVFALSCSKFYYGGVNGDDTCLEALVEPADAEHVYTVMGSRLVNSVHYVWKDTVSQVIRHGEYYAVAFYADTDVYEINKVTGEDGEMDALEKFAADKTMSMQDIYVSLPVMADTDYGKLADYNPYSSFIRPAEGLFACDFMKFTARDTAMKISFSPRPLTQSLTFRLKVRPEEGVTVTGLRAAVSGVAGKVRVMSGMVRNDSRNPTYRQYIPMQQVSEQEVIIFEGETQVLGLFPSSSSLYTSGAGIFQAEISASVMLDGVEYKRVFYVGINMKSVIEKAGLMEEAKDKSGFRVSRSEAVLEVPVVLEVGFDKVVSGEGEGYEQWFVHDNEDLEFEV
ncbi:MAG: hypothetical protein E7111_04735 [Bacteroidales bacterium]|nr:hypothetical protein [Bacteroidales bacterium]